MIINFTKPEKYLNQNITQLENFNLHKIPDALTSNTNTYFSNFEKKSLFFMKKEFNALGITTNSDEKIKSIFFRTKQKIDEELYHTLIKNYGKPNQMIKMSKINQYKKFSNKEYVSTTYKGDAIACSFKENPLIIEWQKPNFILSIHMNYKENNSFINFITNNS